MLVIRKTLCNAINLAKTVTDKARSFRFIRFFKLKVGLKRSYNILTKQGIKTYTNFNLLY